MSDFKAGDLMAFNLLYARHKGPTYRYLLRQCSDKSQADDLMQELWGKLIKAKDTYQPSAKFTTWIYTIAHNTVIDYIRQNKQVLLEDNEQDIESTIDNTNTPTANAENQQQQRDINRCLNKLPHAQREAFLLKQETDMSLTQIAEVVESSFEATKSRLRYAYDGLRKCLSLTNSIKGAVND